MIQYIYKKMLEEVKETIGSIMIGAFVVAVLTVCLQIILRLNMMLENEWYKNSLEVAAINDYFIREKMGVIVKSVSATVIIVYVFCMVIYLLKVKLDIVKERERISVFWVLGYTRMQMCGLLYISRLCLLVASVALGSILSYIAWRLICKQDIFYNFMTLINEDMSFKPHLLGVNAVGLTVLILPTIYLVLRFNVHMMDLKGEEYDEHD